LAWNEFDGEEDRFGPGGLFVTHALDEQGCGAFSDAAAALVYGCERNAQHVREPNIPCPDDSDIIRNS
jgi:hypothetical protein